MLSKISQRVWWIRDVLLLYISSRVLLWKKYSLRVCVCALYFCMKISVGKEDGRTCKRVAIRTTIRKDDCRSNAPVRAKIKIKIYLNRILSNLDSL